MNTNKDLTKTLETCKRILELEEFNLEMADYCSDSLKPKEEHTCGTDYCIAGRLAYLDDYPSEYVGTYGSGFKYYLYSMNLVQDNRIIWRFLFDDFWHNSLEHAKKRAQYIIEHKGVPEGWEGLECTEYDWELNND